MHHGPPRAPRADALRSRLGSDTENHGSHGLGAPAGPGGAGGRSAHTHDTAHDMYMHMYMYMCMYMCMHMSCLSCHACGAGTVPCNRTERARSRSSLRSTLTLHGSWGTPQVHSARRQPTRPDPLHTNRKPRQLCPLTSLHYSAELTPVPTYTDHGPRGCA